MKRRRFIQTVGAYAALGVAASLPYGFSRFISPAVNAAERRHIPLPGALADSDAFNRACIGCGLCGEACPEPG